MDAIRKTRVYEAPYSPPPQASEHVPTPPTTTTADPRQKHPILKVLLFSILASALFLLSLIAFLLIKSIHSGEQMQFENNTSRSFVSQLKNLTGAFFAEKTHELRGEATGRINILLLGRAGEHSPGKNLTDTVMVMSINTLSRQVALLSLPRDLYVPISNSDYSTKLNALYQYGISNGTGAEPLLQTIEEITGQPIHYFVTLDFDGFEKSIDAVGGISLDVVRDFNDSRYPGKNYSYETFTLRKGWQTLDGATALKYVRERHNDPEGDFGRAKRQQQVIQAFKSKVFSLGTLFNIMTVGRLIDTLGESIKTDMTFEDMTRFMELTRTLDTKNVTSVVIDAWHKESLLRVSHLQVGDIAAFILVPRVGNWNEVREASGTIFERDSQKKRLQNIRNENPTLVLYYAKSDRGAAAQIASFVQEELGFSQVATVPLTAVDNRPEESIIGARTGLAKPFSLDILLQKFSLKETAAIPTAFREKTDSDFTIVVGSDLALAFSLNETDPNHNTEDDSTFSEALPPQPKHRK